MGLYYRIAYAHMVVYMFVTSYTYLKIRELRMTGCICICPCTCIRIRVCICICIGKGVCTCLCMHTLAHVCMHACTCVFIARMHSRYEVCTFIFYICMCVCMLMCMHECVYVFLRAYRVLNLTSTFTYALVYVCKV